MYIFPKINLSSYVIVGLISLLSILPATKALGQPYSERSKNYGSRINLPEGSIVTADFIDSDRDGVDDRYQRGPGQPLDEKKRILLPHILYFGGAKSEGIKDLRLSIKLREEYERLKSNLPSLMKESNESISNEEVKKLTDRSFQGSLFLFPDGINIYRVIQANNEIKTIIETQGVFKHIIVRDINEPQT